MEKLSESEKSTFALYWSLLPSNSHAYLSSELVFRAGSDNICEGYYGIYLLILVVPKK